MLWLPQRLREQRSPPNTPLIRSSTVVPGFRLAFLGDEVVEKGGILWKSGCAGSSSWHIVTTFIAARTSAALAADGLPARLQNCNGSRLLLPAIFLVPGTATPLQPPRIWAFHSFPNVVLQFIPVDTRTVERAPGFESSQPQLCLVVLSQILSWSSS